MIDHAQMVLGTGTSSTNNNAWTMTTTKNTLAAGDRGILIIVSDNISTADGETNDHTSVSGGMGTWTKSREYTESGITVSHWRCIASGLVPVGTTITMGLSANATDKCCVFVKIPHDGGWRLSA